MYRLFIRPLLFLLDPEKVHHLAFSLIGLFMKIPGVPALSRALFRPGDSHAVEAFGLKFPNPFGLAAGFDKDAKLIDELANFGFGFIEIGTVTPKPQEGNPKPRLFRLPADQGLINRMGFNNGGLDQVAQRLKHRKSRVIVGGNIGKNKITPNEEALHDYLLCFEGLYSYVDYFVVNVSSPNTPGLRELQEKGPLTHLLRELQARNGQKPKPKPILLKIAPDLTNEQLDDIVEIVRETKIGGIIATNTTISREGLATDPAQVAQIGAGGLSGKPVAHRSTEVIRYLHQQSGGEIPIIGVGGIFNAADAREKLDAGAVLVQVYTGFVYEGPGIVRSIADRL